jgi:hypothetical protein
LHSRERARTGEADVPHMADVEDADAPAHRHVLIDDAAADGSRIFDRHIPSVELDHFCAHLSMDSVQRGLAYNRRSGLSDRQEEPLHNNVGLNVELFKLTPARERRQGREGKGKVRSKKSD